MAYNGWTNRETWNVNLWVMNTESHYRLMMDRAPLTPMEAEIFVRRLFPKGTPDMDGPKDLDKVDWTEIAEAWNE